MEFIQQIEYYLSVSEMYEINYIMLHESKKKYFNNSKCFNYPVLWSDKIGVDDIIFCRKMN